MQGPHTCINDWTEAFHAHGLALLKAGIKTLSMPVTTHFLANSRFISAMPRSVAYFSSLKVLLPVDLPDRSWPIIIVTLKNRTLSPVVERFIECTREVAKSIAGRAARQPVRRQKPDVA
jgi:DNA-binding transcriptional LysR family regulator